MAAEKQETGEKKLLKIIENPGAPAAPQGQAVAQKVSEAVKSSGLPPLALPSFLSPLVSLITGKFLASPSGMNFGLKEVNKLLALGVLAVVFLFTINMATGLKSLRSKIDFNLEAAVSQNTNGLLMKAQDLTKYLMSIQRRNIFQPYEAKEPSDQMTISLGAQQISVAAKNLKLVGISWFDTPDSASAMIEDTISGVTHFLKMGDKINEVTVKSIYADRVILMFEGEEMTLRL